MKFPQFLYNMDGSRGGRGSRPPLKNHKNKGFLSNTGPDRLKFTKLPSQHSLLDHHRPAIETPFKVVFIWILSPLKKCQSWTPSGKTFWICTCIRCFPLNMTGANNPIGSNTEAIIFSFFFLYVCPKNK